MELWPIQSPARPPDATVLQPDEPIGWKRLEKDTFLDFIESGAYDPAHRRRLVPCPEMIFSQRM